MASVHLLIKGKVQGVYYRMSAREAAERLRLTGWVKNTREGHVEALANGEVAALEAFVAWCKQGPSGARVEEVLVESAEEVAFVGFSIARD